MILGIWPVLGTLEVLTTFAWMHRWELHKHMDATSSMYFDSIHVGMMCCACLRPYRYLNEVCMNVFCVISSVSNWKPFSPCSLSLFLANWKPLNMQNDKEQSPKANPKNWIVCKDHFLCLQIPKLIDPLSRIWQPPNAQLRQKATNQCFNTTASTRTHSTTPDYSWTEQN